MLQEFRQTVFGSAGFPVDRGLEVLTPLSSARRRSLLAFDKTRNRPHSGKEAAGNVTDARKKCLSWRSIPRDFSEKKPDKSGVLV
jgi:hypothetical protein